MNKKIVFLIPSSSLNCFFTNIETCSLISQTYNSLAKFDKIKDYTFLIGFDDDDSFYTQNKDNLINILPSNFKLHYLNNFNKTYVCIVNQLANIAINEYGADYLFLIADDLEFYSLDCIDDFISWFGDKNYGLCHSRDKTNLADICTHPFVSSNHVKTLGYFYPNEIKNWYSDTWITQLYNNLGLVYKTQDYILRNTILDKRYTIHKICPSKFKKYVGESQKIIEEKINEI
jgi:hypothetical protein